MKLKDSRQELLEQGDRADAFNFQPVWKQVVLPLSGCVTALLVGLAILGASGWVSFVSAFPQIVLGALAPFTTAQVGISRFADFAANHSFALVFALVAIKLSAFNLLPFGGFNGGQAILNLLRWGRPEAEWEEAVTRWLIVPALLVFVGWVLALGFYGLL